MSVSRFSTLVVVLGAPCSVFQNPNRHIWASKHALNERLFSRISFQTAVVCLYKVVNIFFECILFTLNSTSLMIYCQNTSGRTFSFCFLWLCARAVDRLPSFCTGCNRGWLGSTRAESFDEFFNPRWVQDFWMSVILSHISSYMH